MSNASESLNILVGMGKGVPQVLSHLGKDLDMRVIVLIQFHKNSEFQKQDCELKKNFHHP